MVAAVAIDQDDRNLRLFHLLVKFVRIHTDYNDSIQIALLGQRQIAFICVRCRNQNMIAAQTGIVFNAAENFTIKTVLEHQTLAGASGKGGIPAVIRVGSETTFPPFEFTENDKYVGFDLDLADAIIKQMGSKMEFKSMGFDALIPAVQSGQIDMIAAGLDATPERAKQVAFSDVYFKDNGYCIVVRKDNTTINDWADLAGKNVGAQVGTYQVKLAQEAKAAEVKQLDSNSQAWMELQANTLDAVVIDQPVAMYYLKQGALYPELANPDEAYMTMVTNLFPTGMVGLVLAVLTAALVSTIGSALNALSTVFTMDIYVKNFNPEASQKEIIRTGHVVTLVGALLSVVITVAIDSIKGLNLFNIFQSVLGFIAPPMAAVFLLGVFWKRTTTLAANLALTLGTVFSIGVGVLYLWVFPVGQYSFWPHFMMLSFYLFVIISMGMVLISLFDKRSSKQVFDIKQVMEKTSKGVVVAWVLLAVVMLGLYLFFNGHS